MQQRWLTHAVMSITCVQAKFTPKLPAKQRERKTNTESATHTPYTLSVQHIYAPGSSIVLLLFPVHACVSSAGAASPTSASASPSSASSSIKSEQKSRFERQKAPDRVAFVAASKQGFTRSAGASTSTTTPSNAAAEARDELKRSRLTQLTDRMEVDDDERKAAGKDEKMEAEEDDDEDGEVEEDMVNHYKPISVPFRKQRPIDPITATATPYPPRSAAAIITRPSSDENHDLLFFQLPSHLPLQPSSIPIPPTLASPPLPLSSLTAASTSTLPSKPPSLATSTPSTTSSYLANKTLLQKKKLLTFDPQFTNSLQYVPAGHMGRLLLYRSGRVRMEVGGVRLDVQRGVDCLYHQQVVSVHAEAPEASEGQDWTASEATTEGGEGSASGGRREWVELGDVRERLVCTMDVNDLQRKRDSRSMAHSSRASDERSDEKSVGGDVKMKEEKL